MHNQLLKKALAVTGVLFYLLLPSGSALSQGNRSFTVSPPVFELTANPGDSLSEVVSLFNNGDEDLTITSTIENLKPMGEKGQVQVIGDSEEGLPSLKDWVQVKTPNLTLNRGATKNVDFDIKIPLNAQPGGHFVTILFGTTGNQTDGTGAILSQKIGTLVFLTIAGQSSEKAMVTNFNAERKLYWKNEKINFNLKVVNQGNVYIRPRGYLVITDIFGRKTNQIEVDGKNILPSATREIPLEYKANKLFGPYTATLTLVYGNANQNLNSSVGFWVIPWIPSLIVLVVLLTLIIFRRRFKKALKILIGGEK